MHSSYAGLQTLLIEIIDSAKEWPSSSLAMTSNRNRTWSPDGQTMAVCGDGVADRLVMVSAQMNDIGIVA